MGALKWGLKATLCNLRTIVYNCALLWPFWAASPKGNFRRKMTTIVGNRGQLWISTLSAHLLSPHLDFPHCLSEESHEEVTKNQRAKTSQATFIECFRGQHRGRAQFYFNVAVLWTLSHAAK